MPIACRRWWPDLVRRQVGRSGRQAQVALAKAATQSSWRRPTTRFARSCRRFAQPGGNATGINFLVTEITAKRLRLLHDMVPKAVRVALLVNPANTNTAKTTLRDVQEAARTIGLQIQILSASTIGEINATFATLERDRSDALFVSGDAFFLSRRVQLATLTVHGRIPAIFSSRDYVEAGGLMSYGTNFGDTFRQVGSIRAKSSKAPSPPSCRCCNRPNLSSSSSVKRRDLHRR